MTVDQLIKSFSTKPAPKEAHVAMVAFLRGAAPAEVERFVARALASVPAGGTFFDAALSHIDEDAYARLLPLALQGLRAPVRQDACESLIAYASLQQPQALRPYLTQLFALDPNGRSYYANWPWRGALPEDMAFLASQLAQSEQEQRHKAWLCLLQTRQPQALALAARSTAQAGLRHPLESYLLEVGYAAVDRPLYAEACSHLIFPAGHCGGAQPAWSPRALHPTWTLPTEGAALQFGGAGSAACGLCGGTLHHLLTLPTTRVFSGAPDAGAGAAAVDLNADADAGIALETCLSCLGWEADTLHFKHGADGRPRALDSGAAKPEFVAEPLRETPCRLAPTPARWQWQDWALSNNRENLHRVGGHPTWIQSAQFPACRDCGATMRFILQLDSDLPDGDGGEWSWGSGGIAYAFACAPCRNTAYLWQCT